MFMLTVMLILLKHTLISVHLEVVIRCVPPMSISIISVSLHLLLSLSLILLSHSLLLFSILLNSYVFCSKNFFLSFKNLILSPFTFCLHLKIILLF